jgi:hypothetical protein
VGGGCVGWGRGFEFEGSEENGLDLCADLNMVLEA